MTIARLGRKAAALGAFIGSWALATSVAFAQDPYTYVNPVLSRDSGATCVGKTQADEVRLWHRAWGAQTINSTAATEVLCPVNRRNTASYGQQSDPDRNVSWKRLTIWVYSNNDTTAISCRAFANPLFMNTVIESPVRYACGTAGGCTTPPTNTRIGNASITFDFPIGNTELTRQFVVNFGYRCTIPPDKVTSSTPPLGASTIVGSEGEFASESTNTPGPAVAWAVTKTFNVAFLTTYGSKLYEARQLHTATVGWEPPNAPALWRRPTPVGITPWEKQTAYQLESQVTYSGKTYECIQAHQSEATWTPTAAPALWKRISN